MSMSQWSCKFLPTPGRAWTVSMPAAARSAGSPMPESWSSLAEPKAPAETMTSRFPCRCVHCRPQWPGPRRPAIFNDHPGDGHVGTDNEVASLAGRFQVGHGRAAPAAVLRGGLVKADAVLLGAVEVAVVGQTKFLARFHESRREFVRAEKVTTPGGHGCRGAGGESRLLDSERTNTCSPRPRTSLRAVVGDPAVVVLGHAAGENLGIDGAPAAQHAALGERNAAAVAVLLRNAGIVPLVWAVLELGETGRNVDEWVAVRSAGLEQQDTPPRDPHSAGPPGRCHRRRPGNYVIVGSLVRPHAPNSSLTADRRLKRSLQSLVKAR